MPTSREIVLAAVEAFRSGDLDLTLRDWADDCLFVNDAGILGTRGTWHGPQGFRRWLQETTEGISDYELDVLDLEETGERVAVTFRESGRGPASGIAMQRQVRVVYTIQDEKITRLETSDLGDQRVTT